MTTVELKNIEKFSKLGVINFSNNLNWKKSATLKNLQISVDRRNLIFYAISFQEEKKFKNPLLIYFRIRQNIRSRGK